jgi:hypothetical protein
MTWRRAESAERLRLSLLSSRLDTLLPSASSLSLTHLEKGKTLKTLRSNARPSDDPGLLMFGSRDGPHQDADGAHAAHDAPRALLDAKE